MSGSAVALESVRVHYGDYVAIDGLSFDVPPGQFVGIVGPTGSGKSSVLNLVAGLVPPTEGTVRVDGRPLSALNRGVAYVFQQDALLPWKTVFENVALGPKLRGEGSRDAGAWIERVGLKGLESRYPWEVSGGQRKRVAMAQALINMPPLLLMDEPFSALDVQTRALMEQELLGLWKDQGATVLFVTHDLEEAVALSDRVVLLTRGPRARMKAEYEVPLPRPRDVLGARFQPGFDAIYKGIFQALREEVDGRFNRA